jgi:lipopolysaccharide/colanic/teichoic acid biosynthesis glycosyltransferase
MGMGPSTLRLALLGSCVKKKRLYDIALACILVLIACPLGLVVAFATWLDSGRPLLYCQRRVGWHGQLFTLYKFRSMRVDAEDPSGAVWAKYADHRITRVGRVLRKFRLDELPQLYNVLRGDMSLVGPRPERPEFVPGLSKAVAFYENRHSVKPGLTGLAQIHLPYGDSIRDATRKLHFDLYYIEHWSLILDFQITLRTIKVMILGQGSR